MDTYENEYTKVKKSPYADSPYECAWEEPAVVAEKQPEYVPAPQKPKRGLGPLVAVVLLVTCCIVTALAVTAIWQGKMDRMERAMDEKFAALKQLYSESKTQNASPLPETGPLTPGQVYAKNVKAVVAVNAQYESAGGIGESVGSGFLISADGYVVTNCHMVGGATKVTVTTYTEESVVARVVGYDAGSDVALLKIAGENHPFVVLGSSDALAVGEQVCAIGNPLGELTATLTVGYISAKDRIVNGDGKPLNMLQTDAAINSGNSGGPLFNTSGQVVGIVTAKYSGSSESGASMEGLGFAIPIDDVVGIISDLRQYGYITGAYLGVYVRDVAESAQHYGLPAGAYVEEPVAGYCAAKAGIRAGDIIVNLGGYDVDSSNALVRILRRFKAGDSVSVTVYRSGQREYLTVTLDEKPVDTAEQSAQQTLPKQEDIQDFMEDFFFPFF